MAIENPIPSGTSGFADGRALAAQLLQRVGTDDSTDARALVLSYLDSARCSGRRGVKDGFASALCDYLYAAVDRAIATTDVTIGTTRRIEVSSPIDPAAQRLASFIEAAVIVAGALPLERG